MSKNKNTIIKLNIRSAFAVLLVLVVISIFVYENRNKPKKQNPIATTVDTISSNSTVTPIPIDNVNDGAFVNTEYGFRFDYPKDVFKYQKVYGNYTFWTNLPFKEKSQDIDRSGVVLSAGLESNQSGYLTNAYSILQSLSPAQSSTLLNTSVITKLSDIRSEQLMITTFYYGSIPYAEVEEIHVYIALWKENNNLYVISLSANSLEKLHAYKDVFEGVVKSIKPIH